MITSVPCMTDKVTLKTDKRNINIIRDRRECAGRVVPPVFCAVPGSHWALLSETVPMGFASSGDGQALIYWPETRPHSSQHLVCFSVAVLKCWAKERWEGKALFGLHVTVQHYQGKPGQELKTGTWKQELMQRHRATLLGGLLLAHEQLSLTQSRPICLGMILTEAG